MREEVETRTKHSDDHGASEDHWRGESDELGRAVLEEMYFDPSINQMNSKSEELYQRHFEGSYDIIIFMILSILSDWKRTIQNLYLPIGTQCHRFQHLNSSLPSVTFLATSFPWRPLSLTQWLLLQIILDRTLIQIPLR